MTATSGIVRAFQEAYGTDRPPLVFSAPGRVTFIGEHTDYNEGFVLPLAIEKRTTVAALGRADRIVRVCSLDAEGSFAFDLDVLTEHRRRGWVDYVEGTARELEKRGVRLSGADLLIGESVPMGAGLSSSAALEISTGFALASVGGHSDVDKMTLVMSGQAAEHNFIGTKCGIMDQYVVAMAKEEHAVLLDCRTNSSQAIPLHLLGAAVVICDSGVKHELCREEYNLRRAACEEGVVLIRTVHPHVRALRDVDEGMLAQCASLLSAEVLKRCRHIVRDNARTLAMARALVEGTPAKLGSIMRAAHDSLRDDFAVSCQELDYLVDAAYTIPGVMGARMTGGGFGGSTVNVVASRAVENFRETMEARYLKRFGRRPDVMVTRGSGGVCQHTP